MTELDKPLLTTVAKAIQSPHFNVRMRNEEWAALTNDQKHWHLEQARAAIATLIDAGWRDREGLCALLDESYFAYLDLIKPEHPNG